jgi:hypothetical protein
LFIDPDDLAIPSEPLVQDVLDRYVSRQSSGTFYLYAVVEDPNVDVIRNRVVAVENSVGDDLMERFIWILDGLQPVRPKDLNSFDELPRPDNRASHLIVETALNCDWVEG